jgi:hypothetical protein
MMLRGVISNCSDEEWRSSAGHWLLTPCCLGLHIIYCVDFQSQESPEECEKYDPLERFGAVWRTREVEKLPGREPMRECLDESRRA